MTDDFRSPFPEPDMDMLDFRDLFSEESDEEERAPIRDRRPGVYMCSLSLSLSISYY